MALWSLRGLELNALLEAAQLCLQSALGSDRLCSTEGLISAGREAHQDHYLLLRWSCTCSPSSGTEQAGGCPDHTRLHLCTLKWPQITGIYNAAPCGTRAAARSGRKALYCQKRMFFSIPKAGDESSPPSPAIAPLNHPLPQVSPFKDVALPGAVQAGEPKELQFSICHSPLAKVTVRGSCKGCWEASVNYPTCRLQPFLVFATGEKSSFRAGRGGE